MRILSIDEKPIEYYPYLNVGVGGRDNFGNPKIEQVQLPIYKGIVTELPEDIDALLVMSDLQGMVRENGKEKLLGVVLPEFLDLLIESEFPELSVGNIGVFLCGDMYANLERRGGLGDVRQVWLKFREYFKWVAGVAGNHDAYGTAEEFAAFQAIDNIHYFKWNKQKIEDMLIAGISGIIGTKRRPFRVQPDLYLTYLKKLLSYQPDFMLLHQSPNHPDLKVNGSVHIREILEQSPSTIVCCGHSHWKVPFGEYANGTQVLNVDSRVVLLVREE